MWTQGNDIGALYQLMHGVPIWLRRDCNAKGERWNTETAVVVVDPDDYDRVMAAQPFLLKEPNGREFRPAVWLDHGKFQSVSHFVLGLPLRAGIVDHINGDRFDCRRANLRLRQQKQVA